MSFWVLSLEKTTSELEDQHVLTCCAKYPVLGAMIL